MKLSRNQLFLETWLEAFTANVPTIDGLNWASENDVDVDDDDEDTGRIIPTKSYQSIFYRMEIFLSSELNLGLIRRTHIYLRLGCANNLIRYVVLKRRKYHSRRRKKET